MTDLQFYSYSVSHLHVTLSVLLWFAMAMLCYRQTSIYNSTTLATPEEEVPEYYKPFGFQLRMLILGVVFCTFGCTGGDFLHYEELFDLNAKSSIPIHFEEYYFYLAKYLPHYYFLWRFCIWGVGFYFVYRLIKLIDTDADIAYLVFVLYLLNYFPNPRQSLGITLLFIGITLLLKLRDSNSPIFTSLIALLVILLSSIFHSTMFAYMALGVICFLPGIKNRYGILIPLCLLPLLYMQVKGASVFFANLLFSSNDDAMLKTTRYLDSDFRNVSNIFGWIKLIINRGPFVTLLLLSIWRIFFKNELVTYFEKYMLFFACVLVFVSILFSGNEVSAFLSTRMWDTAIFPLALFSMVYIREHWDEKIIRLIMLALFVSNSYNLIYEIYAVDKLNAEFAL